MELLVDIGNSRIKWSDPDRLVLGDVSAGSCDDLLGLLNREWSSLERPSSVWVSSVLDHESTNTLTSWSWDTWKIRPFYVKSESRQQDVVNGYRNPAQLGVDRWMALIAARALSKRPLIVVDSGTATTIDALDSDGQHLGGVILPGLEMMREGLLGKTAIPAFDQASNQSCFALDTASGIQSGSILATRCLIESLAENLHKRVNEEVVCLLTGGGAGNLRKSLEIRVHHEPNLVLQGVALLAREAADL